MATRRKPAARRSAQPKKITEEDVKAAVDVISSDYWQDVRECAADFVDRFQKGSSRTRRITASNSSSTSMGHSA